MTARSLTALLALSAVTGACLDSGVKTGISSHDASGGGLPPRQTWGTVGAGTTHPTATVSEYAPAPTVTVPVRVPDAVTALPSTTVIPVPPSTTQPPSWTAEGTSAPSNGAETPAPAETADERTLHQYGMYESGPDVVELQMLLGLKSVDGIYGPVTRAAHMNYLGGPKEAVRVFYPDFTHAQGAPVTGPLPTLGELINRFFREPDRSWARKVAFCESSGQTYHTGSAEVSSALAVGWFQHMAKYWTERSTAAGWTGYGIFNGEANVAVAAWLYYTSGPQHWNPSRTCWEAATNG